jgi:hypothetical protein
MKVVSTLTILFCLSSLSAMGSIKPMEAIEKTALSMIPKGKLIARIAREYIIKTEAGTKIKLEFERNGKFEEASGLNLNRGDEFEPGMGLISLGTAARSLAGTGHDVKGDWNLEKDSTHGWVYEMAGETDGEVIFHLVNATSGQFIGSIAELIPKNHTEGQIAQKP